MSLVGFAPDFSFNTNGFVALKAAIPKSSSPLQKPLPPIQNIIEQNNRTKRIVKILPKRVSPPLTTDFAVENDFRNHQTVAPSSTFRRVNAFPSNPIVAGPASEHNNPVTLAHSLYAPAFSFPSFEQPGAIPSNPTVAGPTSEHNNPVTSAHSLYAPAFSFPSSEQPGAIPSNPTVVGPISEHNNPVASAHSLYATAFSFPSFEQPEAIPSNLTVAGPVSAPNKPVEHGSTLKPTALAYPTFQMPIEALSNLVSRSPLQWSEAAVSSSKQYLTPNPLAHLLTQPPSEMITAPVVPAPLNIPTLQRVSTSQPPPETSVSPQLAPILTPLAVVQPNPPQMVSDSAQPSTVNPAGNMLISPRTVEVAPRSNNTLGWLKAGLEGVVNGRFGMLRDQFLSMNPANIDSEILLRLIFVSWLRGGAKAGNCPEFLQDEEFSDLLNKMTPPNLVSQLNDTFCFILVSNHLKPLKGSHLAYAVALNHILENATVGGEEIHRMKSMAIKCYGQASIFKKMQEISVKINHIQRAVHEVSQEISHVPNPELQLKMRGALANSVELAFK